MTRALLLSVRPRFAQGLLAGTKTVEVRRRFPNIPEDTTVVLYSSSPDKAILGTVRTRRLVRSDAAEIWRNYSDAIDLSYRELADYLAGASECTVLEVDTPDLWPRAVTLAELRRHLRIEPAQSFRYVTATELNRLRRLAERAGKAPLTWAEEQQPR